MPKVTGIFEEFDFLDQIPIDDISKWIPIKLPPFYLENFLANKILYPQSIPVTEVDLAIEIAILREIVKRKSHFDPKLNQIFIPETFLSRFPNLSQLVWVY